MYRSIKEDSHKFYFIFFWVLLYFLWIFEVSTIFGKYKRARSPREGHPWWRSCRWWFSCARGAGSVAQEPGEVWDHARYVQGRVDTHRGGLLAVRQWGDGRTTTLWWWWNSSGWRWPSGGSVARGGEGEGEAGLPRESNLRADSPWGWVGGGATSQF
jgi:hypothetical protein